MGSGGLGGCLEVGAQPAPRLLSYIYVFRLTFLIFIFHGSSVWNLVIKLTDFYHLLFSLRSAIDRFWLLCRKPVTETNKRQKIKVHWTESRYYCKTVSNKIQYKHIPLVDSSAITTDWFTSHCKHHLALTPALKQYLHFHVDSAISAPL